MRIFELMEEDSNPLQYLSEEEIEYLIEKGWLKKGMQGAALAGALAAGGMGTAAHAAPHAPDQGGAQVVSPYQDTINAQGKSWSSGGSHAGIKIRPHMSFEIGMHQKGGKVLLNHDMGGNTNFASLSVDGEPVGKGKFRFEYDHMNDMRTFELDKNQLHQIAMGSEMQLKIGANTYKIPLKGSGTAIKSAFNHANNPMNN